VDSTHKSLPPINIYTKYFNQLKNLCFLERFDIDKDMRTKLSLLMFLASYIHESTSRQHDTVVFQISRILLGEGFHREIETVIVWTNKTMTRLLDAKCQFLLVETLPPGMYSDPFQLQMLEAFGGPKVSFQSSVDIEAPAHDSNALKLNIYINPQEASFSPPKFWKMTTILPVHARYHQPAVKARESSADIVVLHPSLYSTCQFSASEDMTQTATCKYDSAQDCHWAFVKYQTKSRILNMRIPIGIDDHKTYVLFFTLCVTVGFCLKFISTLWNKKFRKQMKKS